MIDSMPAVATSAICGMSSMASFPRELPFGNPFRQDARRHAMGQRHAVADEQDHVLGFARAGVIDIPCNVAAAFSGRHFDRVGAGLCQRDVAQDQRRLLLAVFLLDIGRRLAEGCGVVRAIHGDADIGLRDAFRQFHFEIETRSREDLRLVDRINCLRLRDACRQSG